MGSCNKSPEDRGQSAKTIGQERNDVNSASSQPFPLVKPRLAARHDIDHADPAKSVT
jgi:hypothetical protein